MAAWSRGTWELLLLRHGIAEERSPDRPDAARALTDRGRRRTSAVLRIAKRAGLSAQHLLSSPLTRARQTAEIALTESLAPSLDLTESLLPGADPLPLVRSWLSSDPGEPAEGSRLMLVGHEPDLGLLAARLIGAAPGSISLRKAGLALLVSRGGTGAEPAGETSLQGTMGLGLLLSPRVLLAQANGERGQPALRRIRDRST